MFEPNDPLALARRCLLRAGAALALGLPGLASRAAAPAQALHPGWAGARIVEERQTQFGRLAVLEQGRVRYLVFDPANRYVYQSIVDLDRPNELAGRYSRLMMLGMVYAEPYARQVHIGVGGGTMAGYVIRTFPSAVVHAIDIDRDVLELGARWFGLAPNPRLHVHQADGRQWLETSRDSFDVIMLDAYDDESIPAALKGADFFRIVAARLARTGVVMQNVYTGQVDRGQLIAAMGGSFDHIDVYRIGQSDVFAAYRGKRKDPEALRRRARQLDASLRPPHPLEQSLEFRARG
ncbi:fused MFS/spermidine synthase [Piscinibacter koreensis]|uniref:Fused MFS/spermidine synthase n=1 Tax=Piscinibacter koreensis TaxID=2742824 RepID=A0A7Y6NNT0_9BURK|nr:fused MFS/spermidine synthase [Schlegelella koreensis]